MKGHCKHGEFELQQGCPECIVERRRAGIRPEQDEMEDGLNSEGLTSISPYIVKVQYYSESTGEVSPREYTYFSIDPLKVGDIVIVPVRDTTGKAKVSAIDVAEPEIAAFKDKVKTIPAGSALQAFVESNDNAPYLQDVGDDLPYVMPEEMRGVKISPNAARLVDDIAGKLSEGIADSFKEAVIETSLALRPGEDIEARNWHDEAVKMLSAAERLNINTLADAKVATDDLALIGRLRRMMEEKRKEKLAPHNQVIKDIRDTYAYLMQPVEQAETIVKGKQLAFIQEQKRIRAAQEAINQKRMEAAQAEMELKGELSESVNLVEVQPEQERVRSTLGTSGMVDNWKYEVIDLFSLPKEYMLPDHAMLAAVAKKHHDQKPVAGVRFYNDPYLRTR